MTVQPTLEDLALIELAHGNEHATARAQVYALLELADAIRAGHQSTGIPAPPPPPPPGRNPATGRVSTGESPVQRAR